MPSNKKTLYIEASAIAEPTVSGIGHSIASTIKALCQTKRFTDAYRIKLLVSHSSKENLDRWKFPADIVGVKTIALQKHLLHILLKRNILPPMDLITGKGVYLFPNYKNWPLARSKSLTYIYDVAYLIYPETIQPKNLSMLQKNIPRWLKRTSRVITISESSKKEIVSNLDIKQDKVGIVYCGVDELEYYPRTESEIKNVKNKYGIKKEYILFVGNIEPRKNIEKLLSVYKNLPSAVSDKYALLLIGSGGWLNESVKQKINALQKEGKAVINPKEFVPDDDLPAIYSGATLLVHPAIHEGFGIPPLQSLACATPVAVSNIGALKEVIGDAGVYFDPNDENSMRKVITRFLENPEDDDEWPDKAQAIVKRFSWTNSALQLTEQLEKVA